MLVGCTPQEEEAPTSLPFNAPIKSIEKEIVPDDPPKPQEILSYKTTTFKKDKNRSKNIEVAAGYLDGTIIPPNGKFSFNDTVGPRTKERGFKSAIQFYDGEKVPGIGGGVCQVSTTLYVAARKGGLIITNRSAHSRPVDYVNRGEDATVFYGKVDLTFTNPYDVPIYIFATVNENNLYVSILGKKADFEVSHEQKVVRTEKFSVRKVEKEEVSEPILKQRGVDGYPGISYWIYSRNGEEFKRYVAQDMYQPVPEIWYVPVGYTDEEEKEEEK